MPSANTSLVTLSVILLGGVSLVWGVPAHFKSQKRANELKLREGESVIKTDLRHLPVAGTYRLWDPAKGECLLVEKLVGIPDAAIFDTGMEIECTDAIRDAARERMAKINKKLDITQDEDPRPL